MHKKSWLVSWIGETDHQCSEGKRGNELGPIASALTPHGRFDKIRLLTNYDFARSQAYCHWLERTTGYADIELFQIDLPSPIHYAAIYEEVCAELKRARLPRDDVELTFHLSPGTPAMAAIWIILSKTRFPANLIQTSKEKGLEKVDFFFDLANDFLPEFLQRSDERIDRLSSAHLPGEREFGKIIHRSEVMQHQIQLARRIAVHDVPALILGETGTGKELFAEAIHASSRRAAGPLVPVNCGAIPRDLANSELFGHKKGAFTGADKDHKGYFQEADRGTLFLDEVGDLPLDSQVRLLRALQKKEITPVGASRSQVVDVRIVAATHRNLMADVVAGRFREDLFHRLAVGILRLPPLRARGEDLDILISYFLDQVNADAVGRPEAQHKMLSAAARGLLLQHPWPGNVRELYHTLLRAAIWSTSAEIKAEDIQASLLIVSQSEAQVLGRSLNKGFDLQELLDDVSRHYLVRAMKAAGNRKKRAADLLGFPNYQTLGNWLSRLGIAAEDEADAD